MCLCGLKLLVLVRTLWLRRNGCWDWSTGAGRYVVVSWYLPRGVVRRPEESPKDFWRLALKRGGWLKEQLWLFCWLCWVRSCDCLNFMLSALAGGKGRRPHVLHSLPLLNISNNEILHCTLKKNFKIWCTLSCDYKLFPKDQQNKSLSKSSSCFNNRSSLTEVSTTFCWLMSRVTAFSLNRRF